jgi:hypothetical protein
LKVDSEATNSRDSLRLQVSNRTHLRLAIKFYPDDEIETGRPFNKFKVATVFNGCCALPNSHGGVHHWHDIVITDELESIDFFSCLKT